jgi:hypothetical protein
MQIRTGLLKLKNVYLNDMLPDCWCLKISLLDCINIAYYREVISMSYSKLCKTKTKLRGLSPQANYTDRATAAVGKVVPTFADRGVLRGQRSGVPTAVNLGFLDRSRYFFIK